MNTAISSGNERAFSAPALLVAGAFFMEFLDGTVIATALPDMARDFGVTAVELNIGISAYLITLAVLIPASGWIADRFGARKIFSLALAILLLGETLSGPQWIGAVLLIGGTSLVRRDVQRGATPPPSFNPMDV